MYIHSNLKKTYHGLLYCRGCDKYLCGISLNYYVNKGMFRLYGLGAGGLYFSASKIKPGTKKILAPPAEGLQFYLPPLHDFTIENSEPSLKMLGFIFEVFV